MNLEKEEEKQEKETKEEEEKDMPFDKMMEPIEKIPDNILATKPGGMIMKALYQEAASKSRKSEKEISSLKERNTELKIKNAVYEERMEWDKMAGIITSILLAFSFYLLQKNIPLWVVLVLISVAFLINLFPFSLPFFSWINKKIFKKNEKI